MTLASGKSASKLAISVGKCSELCLKPMLRRLEAIGEKRISVISLLLSSQLVISSLRIWFVSLFNQIIAALALFFGYTVSVKLAVPPRSRLLLIEVMYIVFFRLVLYCPYPDYHYSRSRWTNPVREITQSSFILNLDSVSDDFLVIDFF